MFGSFRKGLYLLPAAAIAVLLTTASPASAAGCGDRKDVRSSGAEAHWTVACGGGSIKVKGWVKDTDADNQCAQVMAFFPADNSWRSSRRACPKGKVREFTISGPGYATSVYLREIG